MTQNRLSFAGSQTLLASGNEFHSMGSFNSKGTVGDARRLKIGNLAVSKMGLGKQCSSGKWWKNLVNGSTRFLEMIDLIV